jgi:hypothetical protein
MQHTMNMLAQHKLGNSETVTQIVMANNVQLIVATADKRAEKCQLYLFELVNFNQLEEKWQASPL